MEHYTSASRSILLTIVYLGARALLWADLIFRIYFSERNRTHNIRKLSKGEDSKNDRSKAPSAIACLVGYREDGDLFENALKSYTAAGCRYLVVGIDGRGPEDEQMVHIFQKVMGNIRKSIVLRLNACVGQMFIEDLEVYTPRSSPKSQQEKILQDTPRFKKAYDFIKMELQNSGFFSPTNEKANDFAICFTQTHRDLKGIRLSAWVLSIVLADWYNVEFLWSSDSDTIVLPDTIENLTQILAMEPEAGGASALVELNNEHASFISHMAQTAFRCDAYLNRAALGAIGRSECLNGPGSMFRIAALRPVVCSWYRYQYPGSRYRTVINEDMQVAMLLAKDGWRRLYSEQSVIQTAGPTDFKGWIGQRIRWSRGIHLHRMNNYQYIISQGALYTAYMCRTALYDPLIFLWTMYYAIIGKSLIGISVPDVLALEIFPPCYNYLRSRRPRNNFGSAAMFYICYRMICPGYRIYTFLTPQNDSWRLHSTQPGQVMSMLLSSEPEVTFVCTWLLILASACGRWFVSCLIHLLGK